MDSFEPDYEHECVTCGQTPVVMAVIPGEETHHFRLCGPCCFGTAEALDPDNWDVLTG